jgi:Flp pilus assembly protein TadD
LAETAARRKANFERYSNLAVEAFNKKQWNYVILYVNNALETQYYNGEVFYLRGFAYEMLGDERQAKKDYRKGKKNGSYRAEIAMEQLKEKQKQRRKRK